MRSIRFTFEFSDRDSDTFDEVDEDELTENDDEDEHEANLVLLPICLAKQCFLSRENE